MAGDVFFLILVCLSFGFTAPYSPCGFETDDLCQYTQDTTDDFDWTRHSGGTHTPYTGPTVDHTTGTSSGHYMYIETSGPRQQGDIARLISPSYRSYPDGQCLLFWAHMYGDHPDKDDDYVGTLTVSVKVGDTTSDIWTRSGNQGNQWFSVAVSIPATGSYQVIFEGEKGRLAHGDIAIDDVSILQRTCPNVDECVPRGDSGQYVCAQICTNTAGSFSCSCDVGYTLQQDGRSCNDVDECATNGGRGPCAQICTNTAGNFSCSCNDGYTLHQDDRSCNDVDECVPRGGRGQCAQICTNTVGSFSCSCNDGFTLRQNGRSCNDVNECATNGGRGPCAQICTNTAGSFTCSCNVGYTLHQDGLSCNDDDECSSNGGRGPCAHTCTNTPGSYTCSCGDGYISNGHACDQVQCPTTPAPENGVVTGGNSYQDEVEYTCNHGYLLIGDSRRTCQADGTWTGADPTCIGPSDITPTSVQTRAISSTEIQLTWSLGNYADQVQGYIVSVQPTGGTNGTIGVGRSDSLSYTVQKLAPYTYYEFWIVAKIRDFQSDRSETVNQRTMEGIPTVPRDVRLTNLSWSELRVTWNGPDNFYGPSTGYVIDLYTSTSSDAVKSDINVAQTEYRISGLEAATIYTVKVRANNGRNTGPLGSATARTSDGFPSSPTDISRQEDHIYCNISWSSPVVPRGDVIGYNIHVESQEGEYVMKSTNSTSIRLLKSTKTKILDLLPNSVYTINVAGFTYTGEGNYSQTVNCTVPPGKPSEPEPSMLSDPTKVASTTFPLQIKPASERNGAIGCYHVVVVKSSSTENLPDPEMLQPYKTLEEAKNSGNDSFAYISMALPQDTVGDSTTVTVGDGTVTSCNPQQAGRKRRALTSDDVYNQEYTNSPLDPDSHYTTSVRAYGPNDGGQPYFSASQYMDPVSTSTGSSPPGLPLWLIITIAAVCGGVVLLGIIAAALVCYYRKKKKSELSKRTGTENKAIEMAPVEYDNINDVNINDDNADAADNDDMDNAAVYDNVPLAPLTDFNTPIPASRLEEVYDQRHMNDNQVFIEEYESIPEEVCNPHDAHIRPENGNKNRFKNIFTYDHSRVVLTNLEDQPGSDYINANYIDGYNHPNMFIAAQGPLPNTINDFWRMIWEQDTATIVMVTNLKEKNKPKCSQYWPNKDSMDYGNIRVTLEETTTLVDYIIRTFNIQKDADPARTVTQFHFISWPDFGVPQSPLGMMKFIRRAKTSDPPNRGPIVVHCSAGVGRSGTFIAIEAMQEMMAAEGRVDVHSFIGQMRHNRHSMVQTVDQYEFIYRALLEQHLYGDTEVEVANIHRHMHKLKAPSADPNELGYEAEFKKLTRIPVDQDNMKTANKQENKTKNRVVSIVPYDTSRVFMPKIPGVSGSDYINASFIDGYRQRDGFIATQGPLQNTVETFWRMVWHWESYSIVMLTELEENGMEKSVKYWPEDGQTYGKVRVELKNTEESEGYTLRTFLVSNMGKQESPRREIRQFHFHDWSANGVPRKASRVLDLIGQVQKQQMKSGNGPITVHCSNGAGRTGALIALNTVLERVKAEGICDLFQTVKSMRYSRPHMVQTAEQYLFCYKAVMEYLDSFDDYANFQ